MSHRNQPDLPAIAAASTGVAWLLAHTGLAILDPTNTGWLRHGDWSANFFGWVFFRGAPFGLPLGVNPDYPFPIGSALAWSDSLPLLGILLRPLAPLLPADFQYVGPWLALCFALQGFFAAKLVRLVSDTGSVRFLGGALFALAPPLLHRVVGPDTGHASLTAHWLILAALWLALAPAPQAQLRRRFAAASVLLLLSTALHPYLAIAVLALEVAFVVRLAVVDGQLRWASAIATTTGLVSLTLMGLALFGFLGSGVSVTSSGFGRYSADGLTLLNPLGWSRLVKGLRVGQGQYEGFGYLGLGAILLAACAAGFAIANRGRLRESPRTAWVPAWVAGGLMALFALSDTVTIAGARIVQLGLWSRLPLVSETFRSSGRFIWSLHYLVLLGSIAGVAAALRLRPGLLNGALGTALAIQMLDIRPPVPMERAPRDFAQVRSEVWGLARGPYRHVAVFPPSLRANSDQFRLADRGCAGAVDDTASVFLAADVASRIGATFNSAYLARIDTGRAVAACAAQQGTVAAGTLDSETLYVVQPAARQAFRSARARCGLIDGLIACVKGDRNDPFARALALSPFE